MYFLFLVQYRELGQNHHLRGDHYATTMSLFKKFLLKAQAGSTAQELASEDMLEKVERTIDDMTPVIMERRAQVKSLQQEVTELRSSQGGKDTSCEGENISSQIQVS